MYGRLFTMSLLLLSFLGILNQSVPVQPFSPKVVAHPPLQPASPEWGFEKGVVEASHLPLLPRSASGTFGSPIDPGEMEQFFDQMISETLTKYFIPGATVSVVKDGQLFFAKGYGLASIEKNIPVRADRTLFRIGSTSKLFTWTAIMQLVEQGKLDLDTDVNTYLETFQIPATYPQPVTLRHLMTHTSGFEEWNQGMLTSTPETMLSLKEYVARYIPARVRAPGQVTAYSNYASALAGYIVERVSGMDFEEYVEQNIFRPLGMARSTFRQVLPADLAQDLAGGYSVSGGSFKIEPFAYLNAVPAGGMSATAVDMAQFMIAHLQDGRYGDGQLLQPATAQQMHQRQFANDPRLNGFTLGFFDMRLNQQHVLEHGGALPPYHTMLALLPDRNLGLFVSFNGDKAIVANAETLQQFMDHYYPAYPFKAPSPPSVFSKRADHFVGSYRMTRSNDTKMERATSLLMGLGFGSISAGSDSRLTFVFASPKGPITGKYIEISPLVFQEVDGPERIIFKEDEYRRITYLFLDSAPHYALEKIAWYETPQFYRILLLACLVIMLSVLLAFAIGLVRRRWPDKARVAALVFSILVILEPAGLYLLQTTEGGPSGSIVLLKAGQALTFTLPLLAALLVIFSIESWVHRNWNLASRVHYSLVAIASATSVWLLNNMNII